MVEVVSWLGGILAKELVKGGSHAVLNKLRTSELDRAIGAELKTWEKYVAAHYTPGIQPNVLSHIFSARQRDHHVPQSYVALRSYLEQPAVPPAEVWLDVLITNWRSVKDTPGPLQAFFEDDLDTVRPYLENLAQRLFQVCKQNETLFKGAVHQSLELLHQTANEILRIVSESKKEADLAPPEKPVIFDSSPSMDTSVNARPLRSGMDVVVAFQSKPSQRWHDPKPELMGIWNSGPQDMTPIKTALGGWNAPPICVPSYWVDVEWRLPSNVGGDLWGPVKDRVVRAFLASMAKKYSLGRIVSLRPEDALVLNCAAYDNYLSDQSAYYKGLEIALANHRFWKNGRLRRMSDNALRREVDALVASGKLIDMVPERFRAKWNRRPIEIEAAYLILNGLRKRENAGAFKASSRAVHRRTSRSKSAAET